MMLGDELEVLISVIDEFGLRLYVSPSVNIISVQLDVIFCYLKDEATFCSLLYRKLLKSKRSRERSMRVLKSCRKLL